MAQRGRTKSSDNKVKTRGEGFPSDPVVKNPPANAGDADSIPDLAFPTGLDAQSHLGKKGRPSLPTVVP